ncbi:unnamed protein product [Penicillium olsonii]|nr:unnamed protein product [Penicillium olsonii]CAG7927750.1 unnamed protein product [Penicillium olsonii]
MRVKNIVFPLSLAAATTALPTAQPNTFTLLAVHPGSDVDGISLNAAQRSIFAGLASQNADCARAEKQVATFYIKDEALYLYGKSESPQELYVDRSGMGQGRLGYTTGAEGGSRNAEREGWAIEGGNLQFSGSDLIACPKSVGDSWSLWVSAGVSSPGGNSDCVGITARVQEAPNPNACTYTS